MHLRAFFLPVLLILTSLSVSAQDVDWLSEITVSPENPQLRAKISFAFHALSTVSQPKRIKPLLSCVKLQSSGKFF